MFLFADNIKLQKDKVSYVNVEQPLTSAAMVENSYVNVKGKPAPLSANEDSRQPHTAKPGGSRFVDEAPYSNV